MLSKEVKKDGNRRIYFSTHVALLYDHGKVYAVDKDNHKKYLVGMGVRAFVRIIKKLKRYEELNTYPIFLQKLAEEWS